MTDVHKNRQRACYSGDGLQTVMIFPVSEDNQRYVGHQKRAPGIEKPLSSLPGVMAWGLEGTSRITVEFKSAWLWSVSKVIRLYHCLGCIFNKHIQFVKKQTNIKLGGKTARNVRTSDNLTVG